NWKLDRCLPALIHSTPARSAANPTSPPLRDEIVVVRQVTAHRGLSRRSLESFACCRRDPRLVASAGVARRRRRSQPPCTVAPLFCSSAFGVSRERDIWI
ncbi:hypothetical protein Dimus_020640, partial [Dionaea muscipula]